MSRAKSIIYASYAFYPYNNSASSINNRFHYNLLEFDKVVIHASPTIEGRKKNIFFRLLNKTVNLLYGTNINALVFNHKVLKESKINQNAILWFRFLPPYGLDIINSVPNGIPIIVHIVDEFKDREKYQQLESLLPRIDYLLFTTTGLENYFTQQIGKISNKTAIIPHTRPLNDHPAELRSMIKMFHAGSFYKSAFNTALRNTVSEWLKNNPNVLKSKFCIGQHSEVAYEWLSSAFLTDNIYFKVPHEIVKDYNNEADVILVVESYDHSHLLLTKVVEAVALGKQVFIATKPNSVGAKIIEEYGGFVADIEDAASIYSAFDDMKSFFADDKKIKYFNLNKRKVMDRFSSETVGEKLNLIVNELL